MIFIMKPDGTIMPSVPSPVYQGADGTNVIYLFAPSMVGNSATVAFRTPDGVWTERELMTQVAELPEEFTKYRYCVWQYTIGEPIARLDGVVTVQFFFYANGAVLPSSASSFVVGRGVPAVLPQRPSQEVYDQILQAISAIQKSQQYGDYAARAIFGWRKERVDGSAISYGIGEFTYVPAGTEGGPKGNTGSFIKSLVDNNAQPPYVDGELNSAYWMEIVNFDYLYEYYFEQLNGLALQAGEYKDAAETAQSGALSAKEAAEAAQTGALTAKEEAQEAQKQAELSKEQAGTHAVQTARDAAQAIASAQTATEAAARAEEYARYGIRINTDYASLEELPRPGNSQIVYFIPNGSSAPNAYDEYVWTEKSGGEYEKIGTTEIDLTAYLTKENASEIYATKEEIVTYDLVIRTQADFEAWYKQLDAGTFTGHSVLILDGTYTRSDGRGLHLPDTLYQLHGLGKVSIEISNFVYTSSTNVGAIWYSAKPQGDEYSIKNISVSVVATNSGGNHSIQCFYSCTNLVKCTGSGEGGSSYDYGFYSCTNLINCTGSGYGGGSNNPGYGFYSCTNLVNCTGSGTGNGLGGVGFHTCTNLVNCTGSGYGGNTYNPGYGFYNCHGATNCRKGTTTTPGKFTTWGGTNTNVDWRTCPDYIDHEYHIFYDETKPASLYGGTWEELPQGTFLEATGSGGAAGTSKEAGLPNIKGSISIVRSDASTSLSDGDARLFTKTVVGSPSDLLSHPTIGSYSGQQPDLLTFDASKSNGIYKDGVTTVQPKSTTAHIWRKVS